MSPKKSLPFLTFAPIFKEKVWGGRLLGSVLGKPIPASRLIGESWEISGYGNDQSVVDSGALCGTTLGGLLESNAVGLLGSAPRTSNAFPLLYKFIDAQDKLSVQVHADDAQARANGWGQFGKTECWYIVHTQPGAQTICGFKRAVTIDEVRDAVHAGRIEELLNFFDIAPGDLVLIRAGTVHANLTGTLLYEVQQTSDTTLRFYDWNRHAPDRPLHVEDSLKIVDTSCHDRHKIKRAIVSDAHGVRHSIRVATRYFALAEYEASADAEILLPQVASFCGLTVIAGHAELASQAESLCADRGRTVLIPADKKDVVVRATAGTTIIVSWVPDLATDVVAPLRAAGASDADIELLGGKPLRNDLVPILKRLQ